MSDIGLEAPLVSVIVCNYNYENFIEDAIFSVLNQTYSKFELIIVDDGSTDGSREIIEKIKLSTGSKITCVYKLNGGQASAFNLGFEKAKGDVICFLDSDDFWFENKLEKVINTFKTKYSSCSIVQHNLIMVNEKKEFLSGIHPNVKFRGNVLNYYLNSLNRNFFSTTSGLCALRRDLEKIFPLDETWRIAADVPLRMSLALLGNVFTLDEVLGGYRLHGNNNWINSKDNNHRKNNYKFDQYFDKLLKRFNISGKVYTKTMKGKIHYWLVVYYEQLKKKWIKN